MKALQERAERIAREAADRKLDELSQRFSDLLPSAEVQRQASIIFISERRLLTRWLHDPELRFVWSQR